MRKYLAASLALFAGFATQRILERGGAEWWLGFAAGLVLIVAVLFLIAGRRVAS